MTLHLDLPLWDVGVEAAVVVLCVHPRLERLVVLEPEDVGQRPPANLHLRLQSGPRRALNESTQFEV